MASARACSPSLLTYTPQLLHASQPLTSLPACPAGCLSTPHLPACLPCCRPLHYPPACFYSMMMMIPYVYVCMYVCMLFGVSGLLLYIYISWPLCLLDTHLPHSHCACYHTNQQGMCRRCCTTPTRSRNYSALARAVQGPK